MWTGSLTDGQFQFRWLIWWKFFGPPVLQQAIRTFKDSPFLQQLLKAPTKPYLREKFHYFRKKLIDELFQQFQELIIHNLQTRKLLKWTTAIIDSFLVKSFLNTQKCLKQSKIDYKKLKIFIETIDATIIMKKLQISPAKWLKIEIKFIALLVKNVWDCSSWSQCQEILYAVKAKKNAIHLPHFYKSPTVL